MFYRFSEEAATPFLHHTTYFSIGFFSTGFVFIQRVETTTTVTGVELRYAEAPSFPHADIRHYYLPMFPITVDIMVPSTNLRNCFPSYIC